MMSESKEKKSLLFVFLSPSHFRIEEFLDPFTCHLSAPGFDIHGNNATSQIIHKIIVAPLKRL